MGVASVECECGAIVHGDADPFPADEAFRGHLATAILEAAAPLIVAAERERVRQALGGQSSYCSRGVHVPWNAIEQALGDQP